MNTPALPPLVVIAGPTASGKSALAMALADLTPSVIVNADSMQVYRDLRVVTARPSEADEARQPHRLFGYIDGAEACSAARWAADAREAIAAVHHTVRLPILVGGTGLYIRTLLDGIAPVPDIDSVVRSEVRAMPVGDAHEALTREDAEAAARLAPADTTRVARALEVVRATGRTLKHWQSERAGGIGGAIRTVPLVLLPPRDWLFERCDLRFETMLKNGAIDEVLQLLARDLDDELPVMRAIGVAQIAAIATDPASRTRHVSEGQLGTRQYAKRQYTWFANQSPSHWPRATDALTSDTVLAHAIMLRNRALTE